MCTGVDMTKYLLLLLVTVCVDVALGTQCLSCNSVGNFTECLAKTVSCTSTTEQCYLEVVMQADWSVQFSAGCRQKSVCSLMSGFGKRLTSSRIICSECCSDGLNAVGIPCNGFLCNEHPTGIPTTISTTTVTNTNGKYVQCAICDSTPDYTKCYTSQLCPENMVCNVKVHLTGGSLSYELGCESKAQCDILLAAYQSTHNRMSNKRQSINLCSACCNTNNCNKDNCSSLIKRQQCYTTNFCRTP